MSKEAMKLALEALEKLNNTNSYWWQEVDEDVIAQLSNAETALREALAEQPAPAPNRGLGEAVYETIVRDWEDCTEEQYENEMALPESNTRVITTPQAQRTWVGLMDDEVKHEWVVWRANIPRYMGFAKGIEAKLKEKNT